MDFLRALITAPVSIAVLFLLSKFIGNKQMSSLNLFDYINGGTIGSIAAEMATAEMSDFWACLAALIVYVIIVMLCSWLSQKSTMLRRFLTGKSIVIFDRGKLYKKNFSVAKIDINEFLTRMREKGYFSGRDKDFSFQKAYCPYDFSALRGCEARVWSFFRKYDKSMDQYMDLIKGDAMKKPMPLYVKPDRLLSVRDVQNGMRDHFEGTDLDMTKDAGAGPYKVPYRWRPMTFEVDGQEYTNERAIATQQTGFVIVPQMRNWLPDAVGGILWFGVDDADMAVFTPIYCSVTASPECYRVGNGDMMNFSWTSAFWIHNWVANMAYGKYSYMIQDIRLVQQELENSYQQTIPAVDKAASELYAKNPAEAVKFLTWFSSTTADQATARWKKLGEYLLVKYMDGNVKKEENGHFKQNGYGLSEYPDFPGYDEDYYRSIVKSAGDKLKVK